MHTLTIDHLESIHLLLITGHHAEARAAITHDRHMMEHFGWHPEWPMTREVAMDRLNWMGNWANGMAKKHAVGIAGILTA